MTLRIDPEFRSQIPDLDADECEKLEYSILEDGCRDALVVWEGTIVDGHNRYKICQKHGISYEIIERDFEGRDEAMLWIVDNQLSRRNLTTRQKRDLIEKRLELAPEQSDRRIAAKSGVSPTTVGSVRRAMEGKGQVSKLDTSIGADGKEYPRKAKSKSKMIRQTTASISWASYTWNVVTGCLGPNGDGVRCEYCISQDFAEVRFRDKYPAGFDPYFWENRLEQPFNTPLPPKREDRHVFTAVMGDMFGRSIPQAWIDRILDVERKTPEWTYIHLTKNPSRLVGIDWPKNSWVGATVDVQARVKPTEEAFGQIEAPIKFLSCEPLLEELHFNRLDLFDWVIIGGQSRTTKVSEVQPTWSWVNSFFKQARAAGCKIYCKPNLRTLPKEYPL